MKVAIECRINVNGQWWDIVTEHQIDDSLPSEKKTGKIKGIIRGISGTGEIISRVGNPPPIGAPSDGHPNPVKETGTNGASFTWPKPNCKVHREAMTESTVQKKPGKVQYYCPQRLGEGYCTQRASVGVTDGMPKFWEVN